MAAKKPTFDLASYVPTQAELGRLFGIDPKTVRDRMGNGTLAPTKSTLAEHIRAHNTRGSKLNAEVERARKTAADADLAELKFAKAKGEVVEIEFVEVGVTAVLGATRSALLALPGRLGPMIAPLTNENEATKLIRDEIHDALRGVAESEIERIIEDILSRATARAEDDGAAADPDTY